MRLNLRERVPSILALVSLILIFLWVYGRFATRFYFVLDDYIETEVALAKSLPAIIGDSFAGALAWSGYRPLTYSVRATLAHLFGLERFAGYYLFTLGLHLVNTLLTYAIVRRVGAGVIWAFFTAAVVLLLPSHNEAVLYMSASANLLALFFALLTLLFSLSVRRSGRLWVQFGAWLCYALAVLSYEVTIALPLLIFVADWGLEGALPRKRRGFYLGFVVAAVAVLGLRFWAGSGDMTPDRSDYALSMDPTRILRGYLLLADQMVLLHNSPWLHLTPLSYTREWMSPLNPRALASMLLTFALAVLVLVGVKRTREVAANDSAVNLAPPSFWIAWGFLWIAAIGLPFAALANRNPENRYTYLLSFGFAVALAAAVYWVWQQVRGSRGLTVGLAAAAIGLLTFYAYVDTSDASEWERASIHARSFLSGATEQLAALPTGTVLAQVGVPSNVGSAYVFMTEESFASAMRLTYGPDATQTLTGDLRLRDLLQQGDAASLPVLLAYDPARALTRRVGEAALCDARGECEVHKLSRPVTADATWLYAQVYDPMDAGEGGVAFLVDPDERSQAVACWLFYDPAQVRIDPATFSTEATQQRCNQAFTVYSTARP